MTDNSDKYWIALSDKAMMETIGVFIKHHRLQQNKTQSQLAKEAGIVRSTLSLFEKGENSSMLVFIQILRALNLLHMLQEFQIKQQISPLQLAKLEQSKRIRARRNGKKVSKPKSDW
ncbi:MAG: helix-turn-helix transcriptional regulator [Bacteroidia bacterium]|nr:helix-turn-helix transcriptional regulator [Bacteroidia bacterium]